MRKFVLFLLTAIAASGSSHAQWASMPSTSYSTFYGCSFGDKSTLYAVGAMGVDTATLIKSLDGGNTFYNIGSSFLPAKQIARSCFFTSADTGVIACGTLTGLAGSIYRTTNGGTSWTAVVTGAASAFRSVTFVDKKTGYACGGNAGTGIIYKTSDGGITWTSIYSGGASVRLNNVYAINDTTGYVTGMDMVTSQAIWITISGTTVTPATISDYVEFNCAYFTTEDTGFVAANKMGSTDTTFILHTNDRGATWSRAYAAAATPSTCRMAAIRFANKTDGYTAGDANVMTADGGKTWVPYAPVTPGSVQLFGMDISSTGTAIIVGEGGIVLKKAGPSLSLPLLSPSELLLYPNPMTSEAYINFSESLTNATCTVTDVTGRLVFSTVFSGTQLTIAKGSLQPGMYVVGVSSATGIMTAKLCVQ